MRDVFGDIGAATLTRRTFGALDLSH